MMFTKAQFMELAEKTTAEGIEGAFNLNIMVDQLTTTLDTSKPHMWAENPDTGEKKFAYVLSVLPVGIDGCTIEVAAKAAGLETFIMAVAMSLQAQEEEITPELANTLNDVVGDCIENFINELTDFLNEKGFMGTVEFIQTPEFVGYIYVLDGELFKVQEEKGLGADEF